MKLTISKGSLSITIQDAPCKTTDDVRGVAEIAMQLVDKLATAEEPATPHDAVFGFSLTSDHERLPEEI